MACHICGKESEFLGRSIHKCKMCGREYCSYHGKDGHCNICREKLK